MPYRTIKSLYADYQTSEGGNVAMVMAVGMLAVISTAGLALDFTNMSNMKSQLQNALDSGVLAAAAYETDSDEERQAQGVMVAEANFAVGSGTSPQISMEVDSDGRITGTGQFTFKPALMQMFGYDEVAVSAVSEVIMKTRYKDAEVVFALDYSSSMNSRYTQMRDAAIQLVRDLTADSEADIKFGLVPYAEEVYMTVDALHIYDGGNGNTSNNGNGSNSGGGNVAGNGSGNGNGGGNAVEPTTWTGCTMSRKWPFVITDRAPNASHLTKWGHDGTDCDEYPNRSLTMRPLSDDHAGTIAQLEAMRPHRGTNTSLGAEMAYQMISPNLPFEAAEYDTDVQKFIIMLSDGRVSRGSYGPGSLFTLTQARLNLQSVCRNAAADGIKVITVLYETDDSQAFSAMQGCASSPEYFMKASSGNISAKFARIGQLVNEETRLVR